MERWIEACPVGVLVIYVALIFIYFVKLYYYIVFHCINIKCLHINTFLQNTQFENIHSPWSPGANCSKSLDGWTVNKKLPVRLENVLLLRTGPNWTHVFSTLERRPDGLDGRKSYVFARECWDLPSRAQRWKSKAQPKNQSKEGQNHGIKHRNGNHYVGNPCSCTFNHPKSRRQLQQWVASWQCGAFTCLTQLEHDWTSLTCKTNLFDKHMPFFVWRAPTNCKTK